MRAWKIGTNTQPATTTATPTVTKPLGDSRVNFTETTKFQKKQMVPLRRRAPDVVRVTSACRLDPKVVREVHVLRLDPKVVRDPSTGQRASETQHETKVPSRKPSKFLVLNHSLVRDGILPHRFVGGIQHVRTASKSCSRLARHHSPLCLQLTVVK